MSVAKKRYAGLAAAQRKYRNRPTEVDGRKFASKAEAKRYQELRLLERAGQIHSLNCQHQFPLAVNGVKVCTYIADFTYSEEGRGLVVEDVKGLVLPEFKLKAKLFAAIYGFEIVVVK